MAAPASATPTPSPAASGGDGLLSAVTSLPCVSSTLQAITTFNIGPVTELLDRAAYFPLQLEAAGRGGAQGWEVEAPLSRFEISTRVGAGGRVVGENRLGGAEAKVNMRWRLVPAGYVGEPGNTATLPPIPLLPTTAQRLEVQSWRLEFRGRESGFSAYGTGHTLPGSGGPGSTATGVGMAFVLDVLEAWGELAGLAGTVVAAGTVFADGRLRLSLVARFADPAGGLLASSPLPGPPPGAAEPGVTSLAFLGEVDPAHPVKLRLSLTQGILGSNVFELLRVARLDSASSELGLKSRATRGEMVGSVAAVLSFDPLTFCPLGPIQTRQGLFTFHTPDGRPLGTVTANMTEGRSFRTHLHGMLLPVFRFGGFGPIGGGSGEFLGAKGLMTMNSVISVQPRTLSNLYVLRLEDPDGRYRAHFGEQTR